MDRPKGRLQRGAAGLLRWPSIYELVSLCFAAGAVFVSILGYRVSRDSYAVSKQTEDAQQENIGVRCTNIDTYLAFVSTVEGKPPNAIKAVWIARIYNNSRTPVNYARTFAEAPFDFTPGVSPYSEYKYGAEHSLEDEGISLDAAHSTTIGFDKLIHVSPEAMAVSGVSTAKTVHEANQLLQEAGFHADLFGTPFSDIWRKTTPVALFTIETSRGRSFFEPCEFRGGLGIE